MLTPSGASCSTVTSAPAPAGSPGRPRSPAPLAQSRTTDSHPGFAVDRRGQRPRSARGRRPEQPAQGGTGSRGCGRPDGRGMRSSSASSAASVRPTNFRPPAWKNFTPFVGERVVRGGDHGRRLAVGGRNQADARGREQRRGRARRRPRGQAGRQGGLRSGRRSGVAPHRTAHLPRSGAARALAQDPGRGPPQGEDHSGVRSTCGDAANTVGAEARGTDDLLTRSIELLSLGVLGAFRAFFNPYFLLSFFRASRVRKPAFFRVFRSSS